METDSDLCLPVFGMGLLNVHVGIDVIFTVAVVALALGAIAEFQLRVGYVGSAADGTPVGVGRLGGRHCGFVGTGTGEGNDFGAFFFPNTRFPEQPP